MGFETLKVMVDFNKEQEELGRQEAMNPTECLDHAWPLDVNERGEKSCPICGRIWR